MKALLGAPSPLRFENGVLFRLALVASAIICQTGGVFAQAPNTGEHFDVNDVSILFPAPKSPADVENLISADAPVGSGGETIWPKELFNQVIETAPTVGVTGASGREFKIEFDEPEAFAKMNTWKVAGIRFDPTAPGASDAALRDHGCSPEIRIILQPVTIKNGVVKVHDYTAHLVFDFIKGRDMSGVPPLRPRAIPDETSYSAVVESLKGLKNACSAAGVNTHGELTIHPGFSRSVPNFGKMVQQLLATHLSRQRLSAVSFMGVREPEPWIFFALFKKAENQPFARSAQTRMFAFPDDISPFPANQQFGATEGVSTAVLFPKKASSKLEEPAFPDSNVPLLANMRLRDIPDVIANPRLSHFFTTDCMSCHSESTRRSVLKIAPSAPQYRFELPTGTSGVAKGLLPIDSWNVRNFGWFPSFRDQTVVETVTQRTANESAESADFINRFYLEKKPATNK